MNGEDAQRGGTELLSCTVSDHLRRERGRLCYNRAMARVTKHTSDVVYPSIVGAGVALTIGQVQRAIDAGLGPLDDAADPIGHWRAYASLEAGPSRRLPDADDSAIDLALAGFTTPRLRPVIRRLPVGEDLVNAYQKVTEARARGDSSPGRRGDKSLTVIAGELVEEGSALTSRLVRGAAASGHQLAEGIATSVMEDVLSLVVTGKAETALSQDIDDAARDMKDALNGAMDRETIHAGISLAMGALGGAGALTAMLQAVDEASLNDLAGAVRSAFLLIDLLTSLGVWAGSTADRWRDAIQMVPSCLLFANLLEPYTVPGISALAGLAMLLERPDRAEHYRRTDPHSPAIPPAPEALPTS